MAADGSTPNSSASRRSSPRTPPARPAAGPRRTAPTSASASAPATVDRAACARGRRARPAGRRPRPSAGLRRTSPRPPGRTGPRPAGRRSRGTVARPGPPARAPATGPALGAAPSGPRLLLPRRATGALPEPAGRTAADRSPSRRGEVGSRSQRSRLGRTSGGQRLPPRGHVRVQNPRGTRRRALAPQAVDQGVDGDDVVRPQRQQGEQRASERAAGTNAEPSTLTSNGPSSLTCSRPVIEPPRLMLRMVAPASPVQRRWSAR